MFCLKAYIPHACSAPRNQKRAADSLGARVRASWELPWQCLRWNSGPLEEGPVLLPAGPSLHSSILFFRQSSLIESEACCFRIHLSLSPYTGFIAHMATPSFYVGAEDLNSSHLAFKASALTHWAISISQRFEKASQCLFWCLRSLYFQKQVLGWRHGSEVHTADAKVSGSLPRLHLRQLTTVWTSALGNHTSSSFFCSFPTVT